MIKKFYLKLLMSLLLVALAMPQGKADPLTVGDQSSDTYYAPIYGSWLDTDGTMSQTIYSKSLLSDLAGKQITKIKYYAKSSIDTKADGVTLQVSMMETNVEEFESATPLTGLTTCANYTFEGGNPYIEIELDNPFTYSGNNNLVVEVKVVGSQTSKFTSISWYGKTADDYDNVTYYHYSSTNSKTFTIPMTTFICGESAPKPELSVNHESLNFSTVAGTAVDNTVTVSGTNLRGNINATLIENTGDAFSIDPTTITVSGTEAEGTITVTYNPSAAGDHNATLRLTSDGATAVDVQLTGTATAPSQPYAVTVNPDNGYNFGNVIVNNTKVWRLTVTNNGTQSVTPTLGGIEAPFSTNYTATALTTGQSVNIDITFAPTELTNYSNTITISFPEANGAIANYTYELSGRGVDESYDPNTENEVVKLITVDKRSIYEPNFIDAANNNTTPQQLNCYDMRFRMAQPDDPAKQIKAGDLRPGDNLFEFYAIDDFGTEFRFATINLFAEGNADAPAMYILGEAEGNNWGSNIGVKMDTQDGETFTKQVTFNGKNNENGQMVDYFSFSSKLANSWEEIADYRLVPVSDGNFWITDNYLSNPQNISLRKGTDISFRIPAGTYNITVNATNKTCLVEKVNDATVTSAPRNASKPSKTALEVPIKVTPSVEYYTEEGMPVHPTYSHNSTLKYQEKFYYNVNDLLDLEGVIDYVNDTWSANTATNSHPDHYKFQIRGVGQAGDFITSLDAQWVKSHRLPNGALDAPEGWDYGAYVGPNNEYDDEHVWQDTYYFYDLYIKRSFFDERGITGPVTVVINTTLSGSGFNADSYKTITVNGVEQIIAKEKFKEYSWTVPLVNEIPDNSNERVPMGIVIRSISGGSDFNKTKSIYIYGGSTGVSNVKVENIYKSSMNVKAYTQKQADEDTDRSLVAMNAGAKSDVNVLAYGDPAVTGYVLNKNTSASTTGMTQVASANHEANGKYTVNSIGTYNGTYDYNPDGSLGDIEGMWLPMYPASENEYYLPVTYANGFGDDGVKRSEGNTYGSAMQQVQKNGSVDFNSSKCDRSNYTWSKDGVTYSYFSPTVVLEGELPAATGYQLYKYRLWVDYNENAPAWDFEIDTDGKTHLTTLMDRPLGEVQIQDQNTGTATIGGALPEGAIKKDWIFVAPADLDKVKLVARFYYKKNSEGKARPTDRDRLYYVVEKQVEVPVNQIITGIDNVSSKAVANVKYYNMMGIESDVPFQGINIEVTTYTDGSRTTRKIMK